MPSPFPGMDPYLEEPGIWPDVHHELISGVRAVLSHELRPRYSVRVEQRVYVSDENDIGRGFMVPDVRISLPPHPTGTAYQPEGTCTVEVAEPVEGITLFEEEMHESYIEIVDLVDRSVVTVIEVLSPTNKAPGAASRKSYEAKRQQVMNSPTHLVEIDLLRTGVPITVHPGLPPHEYLVHVSRANRRPRATLWPIRLSQKLPAVKVPLKRPDEEVALDLQAVFQATYDRAGYDLEIDYAKEPRPPLDPKWQDWAHRLLSEKSLRPATPG